MKKYHFYRQKEHITQTIQATYQPERDWKQDPKGYFLIRLERNQKKIEVGFATNTHVITKRIIGSSAQEMYNTLVRKRLLTRREHAAYLGKELYKAELALKYGLNYRQDFPLLFPLPEKVKVRNES